MDKTVVELDNRGLNPPEPMMRILDALASLPEGGEVVARNDREPLFLYPMLQERGFTWQTEPRPEGWFQVRVWKDTTA
jgi:uncharacterized protein (DUF2249 family)